MAAVTFYVPYMFLFFHAIETEANTSDPLYLILAFCVASMASRIGIGFSSDHTFDANRAIFQGALLGTHTFQQL